MSKLKTNTIRHVDGSNDNITLDSSQNVTVEGKLKVGTSSTSTRPISIYSASDAQIQFQGSGTGTGNGNADGFTVGNSGGTDATLWNYENGYLRFATNNSEKARIDSSGRLLVGSTDGATYSDGGADDVIIGSTTGGKNDGITIVSNSSQNGGICFADNDSATSGLVGYVHNGDYLRFFTGGSLRLRLDSDGLKFGSNTAAANALDAYEEGTFTATCDNGVTLHSNANTLVYTKIGRLVTVQGQVRVNGSNGNSTFVIENLPFASADQTDMGEHAAGAVRAWDWDLPSGVYSIVCITSGGTSNLEFWNNKDDTGAGETAADGHGYLLFSITYMAAT